MTKDYTKEEWKEVVEAVNEYVHDVPITALAQLWVKVELDFLKKEGREEAVEFGYLEEKTDPK